MVRPSARPLGTKRFAGECIVSLPVDRPEKCALVVGGSLRQKIVKGNGL